MTAGRELDILVGQKVFGWDTSLAEGWSPSEHHKAAWEVVEKMRADGWSIKIWQPASEGKEYAIVSFICSAGPCARHGNARHNHHGAYDIEAETLPLAICKAALIAVKALPEVRSDL